MGGKKENFQSNMDKSPSKGKQSNARNFLWEITKKKIPQTFPPKKA